MTHHHEVWSSQMSELPLVVTARLHVTRLRRDEGMPRHPTAGCTTSTDTRTEASFTVTLRNGKGQPGLRARGGGGQNDYPIAGHHHCRRQGQALRAACGRP
jgi:hypothetical protein